jgi:hypothetical protein
MDIAYVDSEGWLVGMHGTIPRKLDRHELDRLHEVRAEINQIAWGRSWKNDKIIDTQTLTFELPADVTLMLCDAKLAVEHPSLEAVERRRRAHS